MLLETAVVAPVLFVLLFLVVEAGNIFYANLAVDEMAGHADRSAAVYGLQSDADYQVLQKIAKEKGANDVKRVQTVVIYKASSRSAGPSSTCKAGTADSSCSVYTSADFAKTSANLTCGWCPANRNSGDLIGVWIRYSQPSVTGLLSARTLSSQSVGRIEAAS